jgi:hypothetical protein
VSTRWVFSNTPELEIGPTLTKIGVPYRREK